MSGAAPTTPVRVYGADLIAVAERAIDHGLAHGAPPAVDAAPWPEPLRAERASFVTLLDGDGRLRGCIGTIDPHRPLVADINANAFAAAFEDPRFAPLRSAERAGVSCELSILTPPEPMDFTDEADIVQRLCPGVDGVLIEAGTRRGTLLPAVWEQLPDPVGFWRTLKRKAGAGNAARGRDRVSLSRGAYRRVRTRAFGFPSWIAILTAADVGRLLPEPVPDLCNDAPKDSVPPSRPSSLSCW